MPCERCTKFNEYIYALEHKGVITRWVCEKCWFKQYNKDRLKANEDYLKKQYAPIEEVEELVGIE